jgi:hypothetical protein
MFKKKNGIGENVVFPEVFKLPKMPSARQLLKAIEEREKANEEREKTKTENVDETVLLHDEPDEK